MWKNTSSAIFVSNTIFFLAHPILFDSLFSATRDECEGGKFFDFFPTFEINHAEAVFSPRAKSNCIKLFIPPLELFHVRQIRKALWGLTHTKNKLINWFFTQYRFVFILLEIMFIFPFVLYGKYRKKELYCGTCVMISLHEKIKFRAIAFFVIVNLRERRAFIECEGVG